MPVTVCVLRDGVVACSSTVRDGGKRNIATLVLMLITNWSRGVHSSLTCFDTYREQLRRLR